MNQQQFLIPGGKEKGTPVDQASPATLSYWIDRIGTALNEGASRNADADKRLVTAMRTALNAQGGAQRGGARAQTQQQRPAQNERAPETRAPNSLAVRAEVDKLSGSFSDRASVMAMMRAASEVAHLVTPQTSCGELPAGCAVSASAVYIDADRESYAIPGTNDRGLDKTALAKISAAAGIDWDPVGSCRLDDGSDPRYVHYRAVGRVRNFDGSMRTEVGTVEMDLRDGSDTAANMGDKELALVRKFILRHAESKAMNRVVRRLGIRTKYTREDLAKPFVVAKLAFTGQTDDPTLKRMFAARIADTFLGARQTLYGNQPAALPTGHAPPPVGVDTDGDDDERYTREPDGSTQGDDYSQYDDDTADDGYDHTTGEVVDGPAQGSLKV